MILFSCFFISFTITILIERRLNLNWFKITITLTVVISLFPVREHNIRSLKLLTLTSSLCQPGTLTLLLTEYYWLCGASGGSSVVDQLGCSSLSRCTSTRTTVGGAEGGGAVSGDASVTRMLTALLAWGDGVLARAGGVGRLAELLRDVRRSEPVKSKYL